MIFLLKFMKYNRDDPNRWFYALFYTKSDFRNHQKTHMYGHFIFYFATKTTSFSYFFLIKKTTVENNEYLMFNDDEDVRLQTDNCKKYFTK